MYVRHKFNRCETFLQCLFNVESTRYWRNIRNVVIQRSKMLIQH